MAQETTYSGKLGRLTRLNATLIANASEIPHLDGVLGRFDQILTEAGGVFQQQASLMASKQELSKRLATLLIEGERLAAAIEKLLKEHYGLRSEKLAQFGLQPFRGLVRKAKPTSPQPPETPDGQPIPAAASPAESK